MRMRDWIGTCESRNVIIMFGWASWTVLKNFNEALSEDELCNPISTGGPSFALDVQL